VSARTAFVFYSQKGEWPENLTVRNDGEKGERVRPVRFVLHPPYGEASADGCAELRRCGAPGELLSLAVGIRADRAVSEVSLEASPLSGPNGSWPDGSIDVNVVKVWPQAGIGVYQTAPINVPELLVKDDRIEMADGYTPWCGHWRHAARRAPYYRAPEVRLHGAACTSLAAHEQKQIWVTVRIPDACPAGTYTGILEATTGNSSDELPITIDVLPLRLAEAKQDVMLWFKGSLDCRRNQHFLRVDLFEAQLRDIYDHGFRTISLNESDRDLLRQALSIARSVGFHRVVLSEPFVDEIDPADFAPMMPVYYLSDELDARGPETINHHIANWREARRRESPTMISLLNHSSARRFEAHGDIGHSPDIFAFYLPRNRGIFAGSSRANVPGSIYYYWLAHMEKPLVHRVLSGCYLWKSGADGISPYCYQHLPLYPNSPFNDFDEWEPAEPSASGRFRDHMVTYPARHGVMATVQWKGMSDGITDLRYLRTIDGLIADASRSSRSELRQQAAIARENVDRFLDRISLSEINVDSDSDPMPYSDLPAEAFQAFRDEMARGAAQLQQQLALCNEEERSLQ